MHLSQYLFQNNLTPTQFARMIGVRSRMTVHRYISGERVPHPTIILRIEKVTDGKVTAEDFPPPKRLAARCRGRVCPEQDNSRRYPWTRQQRYEQRADKALQRMLKEPREGDGLSPPLQKAVDLLGERVEMDKQKRNFRLDFRPVDPREIVRQANLILEKQGEPQIHYPGVNPIYD